MATDFDEVPFDAKDAQDYSLKALQSASTLGARDIVRELDDADAMDDGIVPGWELSPRN